MNHLYVSVYNIHNKKAFCGINSVLILNTYSYLKLISSSKTILYLVIDEKCEDASIVYNLQSINYEVIDKMSLSSLVLNCTLPVLRHDDQFCTAGVCSVLRQLVVSFKPTCSYLLGYRERCLKACAEFSTWTKLCEVDLPSSVDDLIRKCINGEEIKDIPKHFLKLESYISQPIPTPNLIKQLRVLKLQDTPENEVPYFLESLEMVLSDLAVLPSVHILFHLLKSEEILKKCLPLTLQWYNLMKSKDYIADILKQLTCYLPTMVCIEPDLTIDVSALYKCHNLESERSVNTRNLTKPEDLRRSLEIIEALELPFQQQVCSCNCPIIDWTQLPYEAHPNCGKMSKSRSRKKLQQVDSLIRIISLYVNVGDTIVDFCCGTGHVGILVAYMLPQCHVILLDDKDESLYMAEERIEALNLKNISIIQSNIDYFTGNFDVGIALHACGVATDLVIANCIKNKAHYVVSPCCYGKLQENHVLRYPRSLRMSRSVLSEKDYMVLAHCADHPVVLDYESSVLTKAKRGEQCMNIVDTDRCLQAQENGYSTYTTKMSPQTCTPKNNILVGVQMSFVTKPFKPRLPDPTGDCKPTRAIKHKPGCTAA